MEREEAIVPEGPGKDGERLLIDDDADDVVGRTGVMEYAVQKMKAMENVRVAAE